jgi:hypothetical protein
VLIVDDLELCNLHQPEVVVGKVRLAVEEHLEMLHQDNPTLTDRVKQALQSKVSFHLLHPMIESWFFAYPDGPANAGAPSSHLPPRLVAGSDPEHFTTDDQAFSKDQGEHCRALLERAGRSKRAKPRDREPPWQIHNPWGLEAARRERHPKAYLAWLCRDPEDERCSTYREVYGGKRSLDALDWNSVLGNPEQMIYLRALASDLAEGLKTNLPPGLRGEEAPLLSLSRRPRHNVLRNL